MGGTFRRLSQNRAFIEQLRILRAWKITTASFSSPWYFYRRAHGISPNDRPEPRLQPPGSSGPPQPAARAHLPLGPIAALQRPLASPSPRRLRTASRCPPVRPSARPLSDGTPRRAESRPPRPPSPPASPRGLRAATAGLPVSHRRSPSPCGAEPAPRPGWEAWGAAASPGRRRSARPGCGTSARRAAPGPASARPGRRRRRRRS